MGDHLVAGFKGFGFGLLGGVTSIVKHTYQGTTNDGISGFFTGLGKGLVGTVTKPVIGVLDLASETANAVKETSKTSNRMLPSRKRLPRAVTGAVGGFLPPYSTAQAKGQEYLFKLNKKNFNEHFMAYESNLLDSKESKESRMRLLVSDEMIYGFSRTDEPTPLIVFSYHMSELISCQPIVETQKGKKLHYIELCLTLSSKPLTPGAPEMVKRPRVRCQNEDVAKKVAQHVSVLF
jgi:vacuolar protein sorting-associated protein 13D